MSDWLLEADLLVKRFGRVRAVESASFRTAPGKITAFLGENGAGKTTTLKLILGFLRPDSGRIRLTASRVGYVPERPVFFPWLKGGEIIACTARAYGLPVGEVRNMILPLCQRLAFDPCLLERKVQTYSLGNQKKFSYLQSLLISPALLIVDEPFSALDPSSIKKTRDLFLELRAGGKTLLLSSHLISEMEKICDEFIIIKQGRIIVQENLNKLRSEYTLVRLKQPGFDPGCQLRGQSYHKIKDGLAEVLIPSSLLGEIPGISERLTEGQKLDLEALFLFFAE